MRCSHTELVTSALPCSPTHTQTLKHTHTPRFSLSTNIVFSTDNKQTDSLSFITSKLNDHFKICI